MSFLSKIADSIQETMVSALARVVLSTNPESDIVVMVVAKQQDLMITSLNVMTNQTHDITFGTLREVALLLAANHDARREAGGADRSSDRVRMDPNLDLVH